MVTVGEAGDATPPIVKLAGVKITGGRVGEGVFAAAGGGINVPVGGADFDSPGATLTIKDAVISGNRAMPTETLLPQSPEQEADWPHCPGGFCAFAGGFGAGIQNLGNLTLIRTTVSDNVAGGPVASDAAGAGIWSSLGTVTIEDSALKGNRSVVGDPNGRFAEGGAMLVENGSGPVVIRDTLIGDNRATLTSHLPPSVDDELIDVQAHAAGILVANDIPTTIERSVFAGNDVSVRNPVGEPLGFDAALQVLDSPVTMRDVLITGNTVTSDTLTTEDVAPAGTAVELDGGGTLKRVHILGNPVNVKTSEGLASANSGLATYDNFEESSPDLVTVEDSLIAGNTAVARSHSGDAQIVGAGVLNNSLLTLRDTAVSHNSGRAVGAGGTAQGGGIWNGILLTGPPVELTLDRSLVTGNSLTASAGIERSGGGVFTTEPIVRNRTLIAGNSPDQCFGCGAALAARTARAARLPARTAGRARVRFTPGR